MFFVFLSGDRKVIFIFFYFLKLCISHEMKQHPLDGYSMRNADEFIILDELIVRLRLRMSEAKENPIKHVDEKDIPNVWLVGTTHCQKNIINLPYKILDKILIIQVRPCESYNDEYSECKSIKGRFHQYFLHGENLAKVYRPPARKCK